MSDFSSYLPLLSESSISSRKGCISRNQTVRSQIRTHNHLAMMTPVLPLLRNYMFNAVLFFLGTPMPYELPFLGLRTNLKTLIPGSSQPPST